MQPQFKWSHIFTYILIFYENSTYFFFSLKNTLLMPKGKTLTSTEGKWRFREGMKICFVCIFAVLAIVVNYNFIRPNQIIFAFVFNIRDCARHRSSSIKLQSLVLFPVFWLLIILFSIFPQNFKSLTQDGGKRCPISIQYDLEDLGIKF